MSDIQPNPTFKQTMSSSLLNLMNDITIVSKDFQNGLLKLNDLQSKTKDLLQMLVNHGSTNSFELGMTDNCAAPRDSTKSFSQSLERPVSKEQLDPSCSVVENLGAENLLISENLQQNRPNSETLISNSQPHSSIPNILQLKDSRPASQTHQAKRFKINLSGFDSQNLLLESVNNDTPSNSTVFTPEELDITSCGLNKDNLENLDYDGRTVGLSEQNPCDIATNLQLRSVRRTNDDLKRNEPETFDEPQFDKPDAGLHTNKFNFATQESVSQNDCGSNSSNSSNVEPLSLTYLKACSDKLEIKNQFREENGLNFVKVNKYSLNILKNHLDQNSLGSEFQLPVTENCSNGQVLNIPNLHLNLDSVFLNTKSNDYSLDQLVLSYNKIVVNDSLELIGKVVAITFESNFMFQSIVREADIRLKQQNLPPLTAEMRVFVQNIIDIWRNDDNVNLGLIRQIGTPSRQSHAKRVPTYYRQALLQLHHGDYKTAIEVAWHCGREALALKHRLQSKQDLSQLIATIYHDFIERSKSPLPTGSTKLGFLKDCVCLYIILGPGIGSTRLKFISSEFKFPFESFLDLATEAWQTVFFLLASVREHLEIIRNQELTKAGFKIKFLPCFKLLQFTK